jgi:Protein ChrB, N-terminal
VVTQSDRLEWVLLAYRLPREPSTPRIAVWRQLRKLGAAQVLDGLVALPLDARNRERFEWLAEEIGEAGGEASIWIGQLAGRAQERELAARMADAVAKQYRELIEEAAAAQDRLRGERKRTLSRLRRALRAIRSRDYFPPPEREQAQQAIEQLAELVEVPQ